MSVRLSTIFEVLGALSCRVLARLFSPPTSNFIHKKAPSQRGGGAGESFQNETGWRSLLRREFFVGKMLFEERLVLFFKPGLGHVVRAALLPASVFLRRSELPKLMRLFVGTGLIVGSAGVMLTIGTLIVGWMPTQPLAIVDESVVFNVCQKLFERKLLAHDSPQTVNMTPQNHVSLDEFHIITD